jgi:hypothetical protein
MATRLVMFRSVLLTAVGIVVGIAVALQVTRLLGYLLYNVSPRDPLAFGFAFAVIARRWWPPWYLRGARRARILRSRCVDSGVR